MPAYNGTRVTDTTTLHTGAGFLLGYLISHEESSAQPVTFYDSTSESGTILHKVFIAPEASPVYLRFRNGLAFSTGLTVHPGSCEVNIWASGK